MTADVPKQNALLETAYKHLNDLSIEKLELAVALLSHLQAANEDELTKLLNIPGFAATLHKTDFQEQPENPNSSQIADSEEVWQAYLASKQKWQGVYRRLANS